MAGDEIFDSIRFRKDGVDFTQWPKLSCSETSELAIAANTLQVTGTVKATSFQGDGSTLDGVVKKAGDIITGAPTLENNLIVDGSVGIGTATPSTKLEVNGTVKATSFQGDGSGLTGIQTLKSGEVAIAQLKSAIVAEGSVSISQTARVEIQKTRANEHAFYMTSICCVSSTSRERLPFPIDFNWRLQIQPITINTPSPVPPFPVVGNVHFLVIEVPEELRELISSLGISFTVDYKVYRLSEA